MAKNGNMSDVLPLLQKKANLDEETIRNTRIYEAHGGKIYKELSEEYSVASVNEFVTLYAERIPEEEQTAEEGDRSLSAFHFDKEPNKPHGVPFRFLVKPVRLISYSLLWRSCSTDTGRALQGDKGTSIEANRHQRQTIRKDQVCDRTTVRLLQANLSQRWYVSAFP